MQPLPQLQRADKLAFLVIELGLHLIGLGLLFQRTVAHVLHAQRGSDHQRLVQRTTGIRFQQNAADAGVQRQTRQRPTHISQLIRPVHRSQFVEQLVAIGNRLGTRRFQERKALHFAQMQRLHAQNHSRQRGTQDLGIGKARPAVEILLVIQADADAVGDAAAAACTLVSRRLADRLHQQLLHLVAVAVAFYTRRTGIDHVADARHRERGFCHVGGQHDAAATVAVEHPVLFGLAQAGKQRQHLGVAQHRAVAQVLAQMVGRLADFALARQENQNVAALRRQTPELIHRIGNGGVQVRVLALLERTVTHLHRIQPPRHHQHRRRPLARGKMPGKTVGINGGRCDDDLQVGAPRQDLLEVAKQEVDVQAAFVCLVDDQRVIRMEQRIALRFGQQDAVRHQLDGRALVQAILEAHLVAHDFAQRRLEFFGNAPGHAAGSDPARLGMADQAWLVASARVHGATAQRQRNLGQLRGLARAGLAADDDHLVPAHRRHDLIAPGRYRQVFRELDQQCEACLAATGPPANRQKCNYP